MYVAPVGMSHGVLLTVCFSPLQPERSHLLNSDDPYNASGYGYGSTSQGLAPPRHLLNPEYAKREQEALEGITRWTTE